MIKKLTGLTASAVALASTASAEVKINDYLAVEGYAVASATITDPDSGSNDETAFDSGLGNLDAINIAILGTYGDFSGKASLHYVPDSGGSDAEILDLYLSYTTGAVTITGGKYLSYLGYEAFHPVAMTQLTYGFASGIPAYHTGIKADFTVSDVLTIGASVSDSLFPGSTATFGDKGDGDFGDGLGYELVATYTGIEKLTVFLGFGFDDDDNATSDYVINFWFSYALSDVLTLGGEISYLEDFSTSYILTAQYAFSEKFSTLFRWSAQESDSPSEWGTYLTVSPSYAITDNLAIRGEVSYGDGAITPTGAGFKGFFYGIQGVFSF